MINKQIIEYVSQQLQQGVPEADIRQNLLNSGWPEADVAAAVRSAGPPAAASSPTTNPSHLGAVTLNHNPAPQADHDITNEHYPVTRLRGFKFFIMFIGINLVTLLFGYYIPELLIAAPVFLIHDILIRRRFKYRITGEGVYLYDGSSYEEVKEDNRRFMAFSDIESASTERDWFDTIFGLARVEYRRRDPEGKETKPRSFRLLSSAKNPTICANQLGTFLPAKDCPMHRIPGLHKEHAEIVADLINNRSQTAAPRQPSNDNH